jgi:hypothetical protein
MAVKELVDGYESGRGTVRSSYRTNQRVFLVDPYVGCINQEGVPQYGDSYPDDTDLKVRYIEFEGAGSINPALTGPLKYTHAKITVHYSTATLNDWTFIKKDCDAELLEIGAGGYFQISGNPISRPLTMIVPITTIRVPKRALVEPSTAIANCEGRINSLGWAPDPAGRTYGVGTLWFAGYRSDKIWSPEDDAILYDMEFVFKHNPYGWNTAYDTAAAQWDTALPLRYASANLSTLLA